MLVTLDDMPITRSDLTFRTPGDSEMRALDGSGSQTLGRNPGFFSGFLTIGGNFPDELHPDFPAVPVGYDGDQNLRARVERLLVELRDPVATFRAPILRRSDAIGLGPIEITEVAWAAGEVQVTVDGTGVATRALLSGEYVQMSQRLHILSSDMQADGSFTILPRILPTVGDPCIFRDVYAIARIDRERDGIRAPHGADFSGPWDISWNEVV